MRIPESSPQQAPQRPRVQVKNGALFFDDTTSISFQRTLRIPDDGKVYPLPPSLGHFPIEKIDDYLDKVPESWRQTGGVFIPMYQREAMWLSFGAQTYKPRALKVAIGKVNAVSGKPWDQKLSAEKEDYIVVPTQPWLDGINAGDGFIKQFVAMPLGQGYTVEAQITGKEDVGGIQFIVYQPTAQFAQELKQKEEEEKRRRSERSRGRGGKMMMKKCKAKSASLMECDEEEEGEMGLGAGGKMKQEIYKDPYGVSKWDENNFSRVFVHIVNSTMYERITGKKPPATPIDAKTYTSYGYPWFNLYDEGVPSIKASQELSQVKSIKEIDQEKYAWPQQNDTTVNISGAQVKTIPKKNSNVVTDGDW